MDIVTGCLVELIVLAIYIAIMYKIVYNSEVYGEKKRFTLEIAVISTMSIALTIIFMTSGYKIGATAGVMINTLVFSAYTDMKERNAYNIFLISALVASVYEVISSGSIKSYDEWAAVIIVIVVAVITKTGLGDIICIASTCMYMVATGYNRCDTMYEICTYLIVSNVIFIIWTLIKKRKGKTEFIPALMIGFIFTMIAFS